MEVEVAEDGLFELADDIYERMEGLLPELEMALDECARTWEGLSADDIDWYSTPRAMATARWISRLDLLVWSMHEFGDERKKAG